MLGRTLLLKAFLSVCLSVRYNRDPGLKKTLKYIERAISTVCLKNIPDVFSYNSWKHCRIFIIFGRTITEKVSSSSSSSLFAWQ